MSIKGAIMNYYAKAIDILVEIALKKRNAFSIYCEEGVRSDI
jgi:hypothetical protein